jgi:hypothetical protein
MTLLSGEGLAVTLSETASDEKSPLATSIFEILNSTMTLRIATSARPAISNYCIVGGTGRLISTHRRQSR